MAKRGEEAIAALARETGASRTFHPRACPSSRPSVSCWAVTIAQIGMVWVLPAGG